MTGMDDHVASRRRAMRLGLAGFAALLAPALPAAAAAARILALRSLHTGEFVRATYWAAGRYVRDGLIEINWLLRDHRSNTVHPIDRRLLDVLDTLRDRLETRVAFEIISGYIDGHARVDHPGAQRYLDPEALCARLAGTVFQLVGGPLPDRFGGISRSRDRQRVSGDHVDEHELGVRGPRQALRQEPEVVWRRPHRAPRRRSGIGAWGPSASSEEGETHTRFWLGANVAVCKAVAATGAWQAGCNSIR